MITTSVSGLVFPSMAPAQIIQYKFDPMGYVMDLSGLYLDPSYNIATAQHINKVGDQGRNFVRDVVEISTWYSPPKGTNVNTRV